MADQNLNFQQNVSPKMMQRTVLLGRVKMAQAIKLPESEWAKMLAEVEHDPIFQELMSAKDAGQTIIHYKRYSKTALASQFYEGQELNAVGGSSVSTETLLDQKKYVVSIVRKIGQDKFEKLFLYRETGESLETIAQQCGLTLAEATQLNEFVIAMSVNAEFYHPSALASTELVRPMLIGKIIKNEDQTFSMSFFSPHLARGMYEINRAALRRWQKSRKLNRDEAARLRKCVGVLELSNLKQGAFWRVVVFLLEAQKEYLASRDKMKMAPISLRFVARSLQFAPSTISRVISLKSVLLPWDHEVLLTHLMPGQRHVVLEIMKKMLSSTESWLTDNVISQRIAATYGIKVSRRTITACRHVLESAKK